METQQSNTVSCRSCKEPIITGGAKCPHCHAFQNWRGNPNLWAPILAVSLVCLVLSTAQWIESFSRLQKLEASVQRPTYSNQVNLAIDSWSSVPDAIRPGASYVVALATATNASSNKWYSPYYQIEVFDEKNKLIDTTVGRDQDLIFFPKSTSHSRFSFTTSIDPKTIAKIEVKILDAYEKK